MIWLFNSRTKHAGSYQNFEEVCDRFRRIEHLKPVPAGGSGADGRWDFIYWPYKRLKSLHEHVKGTPFSQLEQEAYEGEIDLIEIFDGRPEAPDQYVVTHDFDVKNLMRGWCFGYARHHQYTILESHSAGSIGDLTTAVPLTSEALNYGGLLELFREGAYP